ncbi:MAG TPA: Gfo/Idh/MocA family oxidoreductase [Dermatophilaceae bacterium]|nr:Gfo/Idh/MocA family oxidoreductase [Dermatophilaceae bacterium]
MRVGLAGTGRIGAFHGATLASHGAVDELLVADVDAERAAAVAGRLREHGTAGLVESRPVEDLLDAGLDALVIAAATDAHADLIVAAVERGVPTLCEKPVSLDLGRTLEVVKVVESADVPVQIGFQRRFDAGYRAAREAVAGGGLGFVHTVVAQTLDNAPPPADYVARSGGIFRDCLVHDFDVIRFVTGREVSSVFATGSNRGAAYFRELGDVDTATAVLVLDDGTNVLVAGTRYNAAGHDVRLEVLGSEGGLAVGLDDRMPLRSAQPGVTFPAGRPYRDFLDRFADAYRAELAGFLALVGGAGENACTVTDGLQALRIAEACDLSRLKGRSVDLEEVPTS